MLSECKVHWNFAPKLVLLKSVQMLLLKAQLIYVFVLALSSEIQYLAT